MRVYALSDIHVDYAENLAWIKALTEAEYRDDLLLLAGDVTDDIGLLEEVLCHLCVCFRQVFFVPGNHDLWVRRDGFACSLAKFTAIEQLCDRLGVETRPVELSGLSIVPLLGWYDFSFGEPDRHLRRAWRDFKACQWPREFGDEQAITAHFLALNEERLNTTNDCLISFSHFLPRLDVMPPQIPQHRRRVYPVLGTEKLGEQVRRLKPDLHIYGHSHVNQAMTLDGTHYVNNAFAYPDEQRIARKQLLCVWDSKEGIAC